MTVILLFALYYLHKIVIWKSKIKRISDNNELAQGDFKARSLKSERKFEIWQKESC